MSCVYMRIECIMLRPLVFIALLLAGCQEPEKEDVLALYYVENRMDMTVYVSASTHLGQMDLRTDSIPVSSTALIFDVMEGSGVLLPSDVLDSFVVTAMDSLGGIDTIYNAVNDTDWHRAAITASRATVLFVVE